MTSQGPRLFPTLLCHSQHIGLLSSWSQYGCCSSQHHILTGQISKELESICSCILTLLRTEKISPEVPHSLLRVCPGPSVHLGCEPRQASSLRCSLSEAPLCLAHSSPASQDVGTLKSQGLGFAENLAEGLAVGSPLF